METVSSVFARRPKRKQKFGPNEFESCTLFIALFSSPFQMLNSRALFLCYYRPRNQLSILLEVAFVPRFRIYHADCFEYELLG